MSDTEKILKLLQYVLLEIRYQSKIDDGDIKSIHLLADLFHNVPLSLANEQTTANEVLNRIIERSAYNSGLQAWVIDNLARMNDTSDHSIDN